MEGGRHTSCAKGPITNQRCVLWLLTELPWGNLHHGTGRPPHGKDNHGTPRQNGYVTHGMEAGVQRKRWNSPSTMLPVIHHSGNGSSTTSNGPGKRTLLVKLDLESAYRMVPVHPDDRRLLGIETPTDGAGMDGCRDTGQKSYRIGSALLSPSCSPHNVVHSPI